MKHNALDVKHDALGAFMHGLIDYAGLFPPAQLDLEPALRNYATYLRGDDRWLLGRFILPATRLDELAVNAALLGDHDEPCPLSLLVGGGATAEAALAKAQDDARQIADFTAAHGDSFRVEVLETALPADVVRTGDEHRSFEYLEMLAAALAASGTGTSLYVEIPTALDGADGSGWKSLAPAAVAGIDAVVQNGRGAGAAATFSRVGLKLRCGGLEPAAFPTPDQVAWYLLAGRARGLALKCTAGLHHPLRCRDDAVGVTAHGFFNVFGAGLLAHVRGLDEKTLQACLRDEDAANFRFDGNRFSWHDHHLDVVDIERVRRDALISFGSCSFDEPRADLRQLGLLTG